MKESENDTLKNFNVLMEQTNNKPTHEQLEKFVQNNFEDGKELEEWVPSDFKPEPAFLKRIKDEKLRKFAGEIVALWKILARRIKPEVFEHPELYSIIPMPNGFIIPGGRFKEIYYWDTYWIIRGLLICDMKETARGMIENLMHLVKKLGHVPNGSRVYYTQRSQPPLLTRMVKDYIADTQNYDWLRKNIDTLEEELYYWLKNRSITVEKKGKLPLSRSYKLFHYNAKSAGPRPESYREDVLTAQSSNNPERMYIELKSGAESGWDFSSRWIFDEFGGNNANLSHIRSTRVIPVDLNAILYDAFSTLADFYKTLGMQSKYLFWKVQARRLESAIMNVLWNEKMGVWFDYDSELNKHRSYFYPSNLMPLMTDCCSIQKTDSSVKRILKFLNDNGIKNYPGGTPTSLGHTGEQWDYPNAWPPLQSILIYGLKNTKNAEAEKLAQFLAQIWIKANYIGYNESNEMFEKYDARTPGKYGGGGEYVVQAGFGWTNGVVFELLDTYGDVLFV